MANALEPIEDDITACDVVDGGIHAMRPVTVCKASEPYEAAIVQQVPFRIKGDPTNTIYGGILCRCNTCTPESANARADAIAKLWNDNIERLKGTQ